MGTDGTKDNEQASVEFLRKYASLPANEALKEENSQRLIEAAKFLHPASKPLGLQSATFVAIDLLKDYRKHSERVHYMDLWECCSIHEVGFNCSIVANAIVNHRVWIGDSSDTENGKSKTYHIAGEGTEPQGWTGYRHDPAKKKDAYTTTRKETHVAFLRAFIYFGDTKIEQENLRRLSAAVTYLHPTPQEVDEQRAAVRKHEADAERLLAAAGVEPLRGILPSTLIPMMEHQGVELTHAQVAEAAIDVHGSGALKECTGALDHLRPPRQLAGSKQAVKFVRSLGFSAEWAGARNRNVPSYVEVEGPYALPELHDYQKTIVRNVRDMLSWSDGDPAQRRGMISMPTGSGKTRVAVQAVVEAMRDDGFDGGILWVADRDELCEQAVEAWRQVWSSLGVRATPLRISRMWGGQRNPPEPTSSGHIVVAAIQTLNTRLRDSPDEYEFLADFTLVVFDEAHRSVARTFTSVMEEIGLTRWKRSNEPFLLGLTATPYRGRDADETRRLVNRYGKRRFDTGAFASDDSRKVIAELQEMQVLARADHATIDGGEFSLDGKEREQASSAPWLPQSVEDRIARDSNRTWRIIEAYQNHVEPDWPTLIFAASVDHAQTVAFLLNERGIRSRAVVKDTKPAARRKTVNDFRRGQIKALVNYNVFREGFDAPKTRVIIIARPVFSPNLYFQMIGRGLRGVKNGGNDRCLILNVQDNIENFQRALAFSELDWLWDDHNGI